MSTLNFEPLEFPQNAPQLRRDVRSFLGETLARRTVAQRARSWSAFDAEFSRALGRRGWIGMTWPRIYGGQDRSAIERYVGLEELLAAGAPVGAHWIADRQSGPLLLRYGTEEQRRRLLPDMIRGEVYFCIGMSEPGAGSDLAALRTRATPVAGGWRVNGSKIWTTNADRAHFMIALVRTSGETAGRHQGLSQLLIDLKSSGVTVRPIADLVGDRHFSEVFFADVFVPETMLIGGEGEGWTQVTAELALERSGPERYLSSYCLLDAFVRAAALSCASSVRAHIGVFAAQLWTLRQMSMSLAGQLAQGRDPALEAAIVKDLGTAFEQDIPKVLHGIADPELLGSAAGDILEAIEYLVQISPTFSLRGGTREILRGIIARGLSLR